MSSVEKETQAPRASKFHGKSDNWIRWTSKYSLVMKSSSEISSTEEWFASLCYFLHSQSWQERTRTEKQQHQHKKSLSVCFYIFPSNNFSCPTFYSLFVDFSSFFEFLFQKSFSLSPTLSRADVTPVTSDECADTAGPETSPSLELTQTK